MFGFGKPEKTPRERAKEAKRGIAQSQRELEREKMALERQEKQLIADIKKAAKEGNTGGTKILAKQLIQLRQQKDKMTMLKSNLGSIGLQTTSMAAQMTMVAAIEKTTKTMASTSKQMDMNRFQKVIMDFEKQSEMMGMREEMLDDTLIDAFDDEEVEAEGDAVVDQVLTEIGLDLGSLMADAPTRQANATAAMDALLPDVTLLPTPTKVTAASLQ
ncbi:hypothetical protein H310_03555 [Aphanomyces invadans]|uniref:Uncharacterized protein n=1 Tax=Aphanomyces invadans TaxID=157072 RepID=A0A024UK03_9STRA|nr:hypothetical protein H310_03555 [Aphanomyces invadans]ETW05913.1 hypothetical protein H310_03555 [Aphanomyces invadans]|eukprot:XP_008865690.1 hypothetical protein H310_03555 [Aphanomyces invadans]